MADIEDTKKPVKNSKKTAKAITIRSSTAEYLTFISATGNQESAIEMRYEDENIWLTQKLMAELYGVEIPTIAEHLRHIYEDSELEREATIRKFLVVQKEGSRTVKRNIDHYSLQAIIAVGFRVENEREGQPADQST